MRLTAALMLWFVLGGQSERVHGMVWSEGRVGHAGFLPAGTVHIDDPIESASKATIFELK